MRLKKQQARTTATDPDPAKHVEIARIPRIKKNKLAIPPQATSKFKRRQINKTWLPTHLWHTKRAHMTRSTLPLWRMAIPLRPTEKSYRATHRAAGSRGCIAWDMSYMSTVGCQGTESALEGLLKTLGFFGESWSGAKYRKWKNGTRWSEGWLRNVGQADQAIAAATVIWQVKGTEKLLVRRQPDLKEKLASETAPSLSAGKSKPRLDRRIFIRLHPSAFQLFWSELLRAAKQQKPQVLVEDLRFEIGSIEIQGPGSTEALVGVMTPSDNQPHLDKLWPLLNTLHNPSSLPQGALIALDFTDPRMHHPPRQKPVKSNDGIAHRLNELIVDWPLDKHQPSSRLFEYRERYKISKMLPSQKSLNRRRRDVLPGQQLEPSERDPKIPALFLAQRSRNPSSVSQGSWTIMLPWSCVDLVWRSLMYYPLTSGSVPRFGGLEQIQQLAFEQSTPWYPADYPGSYAGKAWDRSESEKRFDAWIRRPTSRRLAWDALDLGLGRKGELGCGWACDWEYLLKDSSPTQPKTMWNNVKKIAAENIEAGQPALLTQRQRKEAATKATDDSHDDPPPCTHNAPGHATLNPEGGVDGDVDYRQLDPQVAAKTMGKLDHTKLPSIPALATVRIRLLSKGTPKPAARIYRLPLGEKSSRSPAKENLIDTAVPESGATLFPHHLQAKPNLSDSSKLRKRWLALDPRPNPANPSSSTKIPQPVPQESRNRHGEPSTHTAYNLKNVNDVSHIRVFPPRETRPEILDMFGPKPAPMTAEQTLKMLQPDLVPKVIVNTDGELVEESTWDKHVPCPDSADLIGFVTSGGYNLAEGRGTGIGAIWAQRVVQGWMDGDQNDSGLAQTGSSEEDARINKTKNKTSSKQQAESEKTTRKQQHQVDRERHLCIVRNAGESIGRLGIWEVC